MCIPDARAVRPYTTDYRTNRDTIQLKYIV